MQAWRVLIALSFLLLSGCLVSFKDPLPAEQAAPAALLGKWSSKNAWGEPLNIELSRIGDNRYRALSSPSATARPRDAYDFTVSRHGNRWYLSAAVPQAFGGHYSIAGFELTEKHELVLYTLDLEQIRLALGQKDLSGEPMTTAEGDGVLISSPLPEVFAYLDDPANSDLFVEAARFKRAGK
ncbi:hypothetical protein GV819_21170 [Pseudomonas sp. Fl5BN2]|uniref:hypothetical protein n=1 Tax=unclassified Pseudomonas TaxID=196821 RepID=UPI001377405D|nr:MULTISPECIES: hypothetical protein [unclassified Pseudomonas]NBF04800.1 hypothetical protein [Pseudomonas sp. Fl5BN2]NBF10263.1 hypothetical protein [Pseudomonas sp. Fl4BN1]